MIKKMVILIVTAFVTFSQKCLKNFVFYGHFQVAIWALRLNVVMLAVVAPGSSSYEKLLKICRICILYFLGKKF
jgi:hypothetical protein